MKRTQAPDAAECAVRISALRKRHRLTQAALAQLLGVSFASVNRWENGKNRPSRLAWDKVLQVEEMGPGAYGLYAGCHSDGASDVCLELSQQCVLADADA